MREVAKEDTSVGIKRVLFQWDNQKVGQNMHAFPGICFILESLFSGFREAKVCLHVQFSGGMVYNTP